jgi:hypothetical protein
MTFFPLVSISGSLQAVPANPNDDKIERKYGDGYFSAVLVSAFDIKTDSGKGR